MKKNKIKVGKNSIVTVVKSTTVASKNKRKIKWDWIAIIGCAIALLTYFGLSWNKISRSIGDIKGNEKINFSTYRIDSANKRHETIAPYVAKKSTIPRIKTKPMLNSSSIKISNLAIFGTKSTDNSSDKRTTGVKSRKIILKNVLVAGFDVGVDGKSSVKADSSVILKDMPKFKENQ